jgi:hypothetical protein
MTHYEDVARVLQLDDYRPKPAERSVRKAIEIFKSICLVLGALLCAALVMGLVAMIFSLS